MRDPDFKCHLAEFLSSNCCNLSSFSIIFRVFCLINLKLTLVKFLKGLMQDVVAFYHQLLN